MPLAIFILSILFLKGYNVGTALAVVGLLNFIFAVVRNSYKEIKKLREEEDFN